MKAKNLFILLLFCLAMQVQAGEVSYYFWQGKLSRNKVRLACAVQDGVMTGEMFEQVDGAQRNYSVAGLWSDGMFDIKVYAEGDGYGVDYAYFLRAKVKDNELKGILQPSGKSFSLKKFSDPYARRIDREPGAYSSPYIEDKVYRFSGWDHGGEYVYQNAAGVTGKLELWGNTDGTDTFRLSILRHADGNGRGSDAIVDASHVKLPRYGDFEYTIPYCSYTFKVTFYDHFLVVRTLAGNAAQCFGSGAAITGIYVLIPAKG
jgi:hypothetical protein